LGRRGKRENTQNAHQKQDLLDSHFVELGRENRKLNFSLPVREKKLGVSRRKG
jgi:hypothetical protein